MKPTFGQVVQYDFNYPDNFVLQKYLVGVLFGDTIKKFSLQLVFRFRDILSFPRRDFLFGIAA